MPTGKFTPKPVTGPNGETWAGRGRMPKWLKEQKANEAAATAQPQAQAGQTQETK